MNLHELIGALDTKEIRTIGKLRCLVLAEGHKPVTLADVDSLQLRRIDAVEDRFLVSGRIPLRMATRVTGMKCSSPVGYLLTHSPMSCDELIGDIVEVTADYLRLGADPQDIVADALDQRGLPARRDGAESVPGVTSDETELGRPPEGGLEV